MLQLLVDFLSTGTFRRGVAALVAVALPFINSKFGLSIPSDQIVTAILALVGYVAQSVTNEIHTRSVEAKAGVDAAGEVKTVADAVKVLAEAAPK